MNKFTFYLSALRGELYIFNRKGDLLFTIMPDQLPEKFEEMPEKEQEKYIYENYSDVIEDLIGE